MERVERMERMERIQIQIRVRNSRAGGNKKPGALAGLMLVLLALGHAARCKAITSAPVRSLSR
jgi:hypothetical protein